MERDSRALYVISVAAELAGVHPQTLRIYERKGLIEPQRTQGRSRRYSERDIALLRRIQELTQAGVGLSGVERILELEARLGDARAPDRGARGPGRAGRGRDEGRGRGHPQVVPARPRARTARDRRAAASAVAARWHESAGAGTKLTTTLSTLR